METILNYANKVLAGDALSYDEALELLNTSDKNTMFLLAMADKIRQEFVGDDVDCCAIVNARSGRCPENCSFCAQSAYYRTGITEYSLLDTDSLVEAAYKAKAAGARRFSIVTSGRNTRDPNEFEKILLALKRIKEEVGLEICCSLGLLTLGQALALKAAGVSRYHSNIETAPSHFPNICTTHSFEDKMFTLNNAKAAGIRLCSGGILNLGESREQRVEMAFTLKNLAIDSVPLNILNPIPNTPLENQPPLEPFEILRTFALFRFILPKAQIRIAGGREKNLRSLQSLAMNAGINGLMLGNYLTTSGRSPEEDIQMLKDLNRVF